jgi:hypothetical protein
MRYLDHHFSLIQPNFLFFYGLRARTRLWRRVRGRVKDRKRLNLLFLSFFTFLSSNEINHLDYCKDPSR